MPEFDPYHKWLGISPQHQPPNHYRLLSLDLYESDTDVIEASVDRIVAFLQDVASGPQANASQKLLNEIAAARLCLLDATRKSAYDEKLRAELAQAIWPPEGDSNPPPPPPVAPAFAIDSGASSVVQPPPVREPTTNRPAVTVTPPLATASPASKPVAPAKQKASPLLLLSFVSGGTLLICAIVFALLAGGNNSAAKRRAAEEAKARERLDSFAEMGREAESMIPDFEPQFNLNPPPPPAAKKNQKNK